MTRVAHNYTGPIMHWCGPNRFVTGVHVLNNAFNCTEFASGSNRNYTTRLGHLIVDTGTVRNGVRACPRGTVLVGAALREQRLPVRRAPLLQGHEPVPRHFGRLRDFKRRLQRVRQSEHRSVPPPGKSQLLGRQ